MIGRIGGADIRASLVVSLVAIPFCIGVSAACGAGPQAGFVTAIVGGLVVGALGGARLQISGPAVGLVALVLPLVHAHGLARMGAAVFLAGLLQMAAGLSGAGALGRRVPAPVVAGAVCAAGLAQMLCQLTIVSGHAASQRPVLNMIGLPHALAGASLCCAIPAALTLVVALGWHRLPYAWAQAIPGPVAAVVLAGLACAAFPIGAPNLQTVTLMPALDAASWLAALRDPDVVASGCLIALVASAESLVSAEATAWAAAGPITLGRNRELVAQGAGNVVCGLLGGLPMAGAIPRSAAGMRAGAETAACNVLHAVWLAVLLIAAPWFLGAIPATSLAALLVLGGWRLVWERTALTASVTGLGRTALFLMTLCAALSWNLSIGIAAGCAAALVSAGGMALAGKARQLARGGAGFGQADAQDTSSQAVLS